MNKLSFRNAFLWIAGAVPAFHAAYTIPGCGPLIFIYLFCLLQLARAATGRQAFYFGLGTGLLCVAPQLTCFWFVFGPTAIVLWIILAFWIGLFVALARLCLVRFGLTGGAILIPFIWTGLEYFRSELYYLRFSWLNVGYALAGSAFRPVLSWAGMYGAGFFAMCVVLAVGLTLFHWRAFQLVNPPAILLTLVILVILFLFSTTEKRRLPIGKKVSVAGAQLEFPIPIEVVATLDKLLADDPSTELFVLSEYTFDGPVPDKVKAWCRQHQRYLIVGGKEDAPNRTFYNTAYVVGPTGDVIFRQAKSVPIQFFKDGLPALEQKLWDSPWGKIGICICYDLSYTRVTDRLVRLGAQAIIVPTMDVADWGRRQHELHARVAPVRAAECGIPIFRLASSGISQCVTRSGQVTASAPFPGQKATLSGTLLLGRPGSLPLDRWVAPFATGVTGLLIIWFVVTRSKREAKGRTNDK